jgi:hypothetical protein
MAVFPNIALMGRARAGKDSVAAQLQQRYCYTRVSFADPLKDMALKVDPKVWSYSVDGDDMDEVRLSEIVKESGWERAKDEHPEVRRILQALGAGVREYAEDYWLNIALQKIAVAKQWGMPVVVTDVRYPNEFHALDARGFRMVRVYRPAPGETIDWKSVSGNLGDASRAGHESETALLDYPHDVSIRNNGTLADLRNAAEELARCTPQA